MKKFVFIAFLVIGTNAFGQSTPRTAKAPAQFVPPGYVVSKQIQGDLNKDNQADSVLIIKETKKANVVKNRFGEVVDRNRRGIIIAFKKNDQYELVLENRGCFSSENEDGGVYMAPELMVSIRKGNLDIRYGHGRYGYWAYTFRYQNSDFELIGFDISESRGPVVERSTSVNLLTGRMLIKENINKEAEGGDEKFKETWKKFSLSKPIKLSAIADFDGFDVLALLGKGK